MLNWISQNLATLLGAAGLIVAVAVIVAVLIRDKKKGKCSCGCSCQGCAMADTCHKNK